MTAALARTQQGRGAHPLILIAMELDNPEDRAPLPKLIHPVVQGGLGHNDHVGTRDAPELVEVPQQGNGLQGLAQALSARTQSRFSLRKSLQANRLCTLRHDPRPPACTQCLAIALPAHFMQAFNMNL